MCKIRALEKIIICITSNVLQDLRDNRSISTLAAYHLMLIIDSNLSSPLIFPSFKTKIFSQSFIVFEIFPQRSIKKNRTLAKNRDTSSGLLEAYLFNWNIVDDYLSISIRHAHESCYKR